MNYTKFLRWALIGGLALVFFIPFIVANGGMFPNMFFPFITGKNFAFRILVELLLGVYVLLAMREPKYRPHASQLMWALTIFVAWIGLATIFSVDPIKSFWSNFERMEGYVTTLHLYIYCMILGAFATAENLWNRLFQFSIAAGVLQALYSLCQMLHWFGLAPSSQSGARLDGTFGNAAYLAVFMLFNVFITLFMLVRERKSVTAQVLYGIALVLQITTLFYTQTRGAILGLVGGVIIAAIFIAWRAHEKEWHTLRKVSYYGLGALLVLIVGFVALRNTSFVQQSQTLSRIASISLADKTTEARFQIWGMAIHGAAEHPALGWGQENFSYVFNKYYTPVMYSQEQWFDRAHNQFLDWLIAAGTPAFLLYISLFILSAWYVIRSRVISVPEQAVLLGLLAGYAFNNLFVFDDLMSSVYFFSMLAFAHSLLGAKLPGSIRLSKPVSDKMVAVVAPIVVVVLFTGMWMLNMPGLARAQNLVSALMTQQAVTNAQGVTSIVPKDPKANFQQFQIAFGQNVWPGTPMGKQEVVEQLFQYATSAAGASSVDPSLKQDIYTFTNTAAQSILTERKHDARLELFYGSVLDAFGQHPAALQVYAQALADSPKKQQIMFQIGVSYLNVGDVKDALPVLKAAYEEAPGYDTARILYVAALYYGGDITDGDALLVQGFGTVYYDDSRLLQVYVNTKQYDRLVGIWQNRVTAQPSNAQNHIGLAAAEFAMGDKTKAIAELENAIKIDPTLTTQAQEIIKEIQNGTLKL